MYVIIQYTMLYKSTHPIFYTSTCYGFINNRQFVLYFVSPQEWLWRQRVFLRKTLVNARTTCMFSHVYKKEHRDRRIKDASCSVYPWAHPVMTQSFSGWDKVSTFNLQIELNLILYFIMEILNKSPFFINLSSHPKMKDLWELMWKIILYRPLCFVLHEQCTRTEFK